MPTLYATHEQDIRCRAMKDALSQVPTVGESIENTLARADKILAWYLRDANTQKTDAA